MEKKCKIPWLAVWMLVVILFEAAGKGFAQKKIPKMEIEHIQEDCLDMLTIDEKAMYFEDSVKRMADLKIAARRLGFKFDSALIARTVRAIRESKRISVHQDPNSYEILADDLEDVLSVFRKVGVSMAEFAPVCASSYCPDLNADTRLLGGRYVIFVNHRIPGFCYQMLKAMVQVVEINPIDSGKLEIAYTKADLVEKVHADSALQERFIAQLQFFHSGKKFKDFKFPTDYNSLLETFTHAQELFIVGHETAHALYEDNIDKALPLSSSATWTKADSLVLKKRLCLSWAYELRADDVAQKLLSKWCDEKNDPRFRELDKLSGMLFFTYYDILDRTEYIFNNGKPRPSFSPEDLRGIELITRCLTNKCPDSAYETIDNRWLGQDHPPIELRIQVLSERVMQEVQADMDNLLVSDFQRHLFLLGRNLILTLETLYNVCLDRLLLLSQNQHSNK
jgi:hypothetical protein